MTELDRALALAETVLDRPNADPDDDLAILSRQLIRLAEKPLTVKEWPMDELDRIFRTARRLYVRLPEEGADADDAHIGSIINEIESQVRAGLREPKPDGCRRDAGLIALEYAALTDPDHAP